MDFSCALPEHPDLLMSEEKLVAFPVAPSDRDDTSVSSKGMMNTFRDESYYLIDVVFLVSGVKFCLSVTHFFTPVIGGRLSLQSPQTTL